MQITNHYHYSTAFLMSKRSLMLLLVAYVFCFSLQVDTVGPDNVPQKEKEEARNFCTKELWAPSPYLVRRKAWSVCGTTDTMAESYRKPAKTQTHGGPLQNNTSGTETKEGRNSMALHGKWFMYNKTEKWNNRKQFI